MFRDDDNLASYFDDGADIGIDYTSPEAQQASDELVAIAEKIIKPEIYLSYDVEANGPVPGLYSMLSFGVAAFTLEDGLVDTFERNLHLLPGAGEDPVTMEEFWSKNAEAYMKTRVNMIAPVQAIHEFNDKWIAQFISQRKIVNVAGPAAWDFAWIAYYLRYARKSKHNNVGHACFDIRSYAAAMLKKPYRSVGKGFYPECWFEPGLPHTHVAIEDAIEQGAITFYMMRENLGLPRIPFLPQAV